jgi:predicted transposase/invertase (TIGR01784 family)
MGDRFGVVTPLGDLAFKRLLASEDHKRITQGFIADLFEIQAEPDQIHIESPFSIREVTQAATFGRFASRRSQRRLRELVRDLTFSVNDNDLTVELQVRQADFFDQRALYYATTLFARRRDESVEDWAGSYRAMRPVRSLNILDWDMYACAHGDHRFRMVEVDHPEDGLELGWLEVGYLELRKPEFSDVRKGMWAQFLSTGVAPYGAPGYLEEAAGLVRYWNGDSKEREMMTLLKKADERESLVSHYQRRVGREEGEAEGLIKGIIKGEAKGIIKGKAEGLVEGKAEVASRLLGLGMPVEQVVAVTDLTPEQVRGLSRRARG